MTKKKLDNKQAVVWLLTHTDERGHNAAQMQVIAPTQRKAEAAFKQLHTDRVVTATGILGDEG